MKQLLLRDNPLMGISRSQTQKEKLGMAHLMLKNRCQGVDRISVALYDAETSTLKTFVASPVEESPLLNYETNFETDSSLAEIVTLKRPRIVNDLNLFAAGDKEHTRAILGHGFASSYTYPMFHHQTLIGFVFFNSVHKNYFRDRVLEQVEVFAHLIAEVVMNDLNVIRSLVAALRTAISMVHMRDPETGNHLERMARFSRLIARVLVRDGKYQLDDEQIEQIYNFAPLHDVGKIGIPDHILLKPSSLDPPEREVMNSHTVIGRQIVEDLITNFGFDHIPYIDYLRNITEAHHEAMDGTGYPDGLQGQAIALEARIVAASDVFDALTTRRPYKTPWSNDHALSMMKLMALDKLDKDCVEALVNCEEQVSFIQCQFADEHSS